MFTRAAQMLEKLLTREPEKKEPPKKRAAPNTTTSMRALTDLGESIVASAHVIESGAHLYVCVAMEPKPDALAAQMESDRRQAAGMFEVDRTWSAAEVNKRWAQGAVLTDGEGNVLRQAMNGARGMTEAGAKEVFFEFSAMESYPDRLYLANGRARVRVK